MNLTLRQLAPLFGIFQVGGRPDHQPPRPQARARAPASQAVREGRRAHRGINVRIHLTADLREFFAANTDWLTVFQLPGYVPDLNLREGVWSMVKHGLGNLAAADLGQITRTVKRKLKMLQHRPSCSTVVSPAEPGLRGVTRLGDLSPECALGDIASPGRGFT
jgi:hypothetical protein